MTKTITAVSLATFVAMGVPVIAQETDAAIDTNVDGIYSQSELQTAYPDVPEDVFTSIDTNEDGIVDVAELTFAQNAGLLGS
ncbi:MAG: hypothetical protein COB16_16305 [Rhodobacteraceae bacterium]|nr:MAG: hypothetical protein COB16_16305 [Paracoccaceae bacterium]